MDTGENISDNILLCSNCFKDEGLRLDSIKIGIDESTPCPNCKSLVGKKLTSSLIESLARRFFVTGTLYRCDYGAAPTVQFNKHQLTSIDVPERLINDVKLFEQSIGVGFFPYGPRLWMIGHEIAPLDMLLSDTDRAIVIQRISSEYPTRILKVGEQFYRLRRNPEIPNSFDQYDSPPSFAENGRLNSTALSVMYCSQDLEICIHECRASAQDELYIATLSPTRDLKLLNLTELIDDHVNEFESLDIAVYFLFLAGNHSYKISRAIALAVKGAGYDGMIYPSYFSTLRTGAIPFETAFGISIRKFASQREKVQSQIIPNIALFGRPIEEGSVSGSS